MKRYIRASQYMSEDLEFKASSKLYNTVDDIVNDIYSEAITDPEDPRADYFVTNITSDDEVSEALEKLIEAIKNATKRQMMWRAN